MTHHFVSFPGVAFTLAAFAVGDLDAQQSMLKGPQRAYQTGAGVMAPNTPYRPNEHAVADIDGDGAPDVAVAQIGNSLTPQVSVLWNSGAGEFEAPLFLPAPGETAAVAIADVDGDGDLDLAFSQTTESASTGQSVLLYRNLGSRTFAPATVIPCGKGPTAIVARDLDGDGDVDLATANRKVGENDVSLLRNDGAGNFTRTDIVVGFEPRRLRVADLNADGRQDFVTGHVGAANLEVHVTLATGIGYAAPFTLSPGAPGYADANPAVAVGDVDGDADVDILYGYAPSTGIPGSAALALFRNSGNASFPSVTEIPTGYEFASPLAMELVDVDDDGVLDAVGCGGQSLSWWGVLRGTGGGAFAPPTVFVSGEYSRWITADDIDSDGDRDALITNHGLLTLQVHRNDGGTYPKFAHHDAVDSYRCEVADIDADGDEDIVALAVNIYTYRNDGNGTFTRLSYFPGSGRFRNFELRDLDGDGRPEILKVKDPTSAPYHFYTNKNLGNGAWGPNVQWTLPNSCGVYHFTTLDFDNDGDLDVAANETGGCPSKPTQQVYLLRNLGNVTFSPPTTLEKVQWGMSDITSADFDRDGNQDLAGVGLTQFGGAPAPTSGYLVIRGNGNGTFQTPVAHSLDPFNLTMTVRPVDMDGDGNVDLVGGGLGTWGSTDQVVVMRNTGPATFAPYSAEPAPKSLAYSGTNGITVADFTGDAHPDIVVGGGEDVALYVNDGTGQLEPARRFGIGGQALWVANGDFNADGRRDAAAIALRKPTITLSEQVCVLFGAAPSPWSPVGKGVAGTHGVPTLGGSGELTANSATGITLAHARENASASALIVGLARADLPLLAGILVPTPSLVLSPLSTGAQGGFTLAAPWPAGVPSGVEIFFQAWIPDPLAPKGAAATRGLRAVTP